MLLALGSEAQARSLVWDVQLQISGLGGARSAIGFVAMPEDGGLGGFTSPVGNITLGTASGQMNLSFFVSEPVTQCTVFVMGSGSIVRSNGTARVEGALSGSEPCGAILGTFSASSSDGPNNFSFINRPAGTVVTHRGWVVTPEWTDLVVPLGDTVAAPPGDIVRLINPRGTRINIARNVSTVVVLSEEQGVSLIDLLRGWFNAIFIPCAPAECERVHTPSAGIGVRGTEYTLQHSEGPTQSTTSIDVTEGTVEVTNAGNAQVTTLNAGQSLQIELPPSVLNAALLPASRAVAVNSTATAFATLVNSGPGSGLACRIEPDPAQALPIELSYQTTNPQTNALTGARNTPVNIAVGASQTFLAAIKPTAPFAAADVRLQFRCNGSDMAPVIAGLNTLLLTSSATPTPDVIALAATTSNDGTVHVPGAGGTHAFAVASMNVGAAGTITATVDTGAGSAPVSLALCRTDAQTGSCATPIGTSVTTAMPSNATATFGVFVTANQPIAFDPASKRVFVRFASGSGATVGGTSVAVTTN